jgi:hypothetical protein
MSDAADTTIEAGEVPFEDWVQQSRIPAGPLRDGLERMYAEYDQFGFPGGNGLVLRSILEREPRSLEQFFNELATRDEAKAA